jgi:hypothetical protein
MSREQLCPVRVAVTVTLLVLFGVIVQAQSTQAETTLTVGTIDMTLRRPIAIPGVFFLPDISFTYSVPAYSDGTTTYPAGSRRGPEGGIPIVVRLPNMGGDGTAINESQVNLRFAITNWTQHPAATLTVQLASQSKSVHQGATEVVFSNVPQTALPLSITVNGFLPYPLKVPGLLPVRVSCPSLGILRPRYYVLTVVYAPPGTDGGHSASVVDYGAGSSTGTSTSAQGVFKLGTEVKAEAEGSFFGSGGGANADFKASQSTTDSSSLDIKKGQNYDIKVSGPAADGVDHDADLFYLWLNPEMNVSIDSANRAQWQLGVRGPTMDIQFVYAGWLKNPKSMPVGVQKKLIGLGFTTDDYAQILSTDPFASGAVEIDPKRFLPIGRSFPFLLSQQRRRCRYRPILYKTRRPIAPHTQPKCNTMSALDLS